MPGVGRYEGEWRKGRRHGRGVYLRENGERYGGQYRNGSRHGWGVYTWPSGRTVECEWKTDNATGLGRVVFPDGRTYHGEIFDGKPNNTGVLKFPEGGGLYLGQWLDGAWHGNGSLDYLDGKKYEGEWKNGAKEGVGVFTFGGSGVGVTKFHGYVGQWQWDKKIGLGSLWNPQNATRSEGLWRDNELFRPCSGCTKEQEKRAAIARAEAREQEKRALRVAAEAKALVQRQRDALSQLALLS